MTEFPRHDLKNLLSGAGTRTITVYRLDGEKLIHGSFGNWRNITGGALILTN